MITRKRKALVSETPAPQCKAKRSRESPIGTTSHFPFLSLPLELRDEIYKHIIISDHGATSLRKQNLVTKTGLIGVNNQICQEFLDAVLFHAPVIETTVRNHNFAHVVTFLNRLSESQFRRISSKPATSSKSLDHHAKSAKASRRIRITLAYSPTKGSTKAQLNRWLDRFDDPNRRGKEIRFEYVVDFSTWANGGHKQRPRIRVLAGHGSNTAAAKIIKASTRSGCGYW
ncbi:hypothetical protein CERZMDRAFT_31565 [Cercospora zeae-maydis SCOH1-5]|uniref:F-box domain-containing protein n=1 Tax=Cercospora zeae-maydis SCOH1-5 TaxID=717836 RepID=A0A6A6FVK9_9PEZI|nr:hypothetical protein CERZMDRAFT_31565 [Cercospora zeae-maydis SCOH1-5]